MKMTKAVLPLLVVLALVFSALVHAGTEYEVACENKDCGFTSNVSFGGGKAFDQITGFCIPCEKFVYISWQRNAEEPAPAAKIWDAGSGAIISLYPCPNCGNLFMPIADIQTLKYCPICRQETLKRKAKITMYD